MRKAHHVFVSGLSCTKILPVPTRHVMDLCWFVLVCKAFLSWVFIFGHWSDWGVPHTSSLPKSTTEPKLGRFELRKLECTLFFGGVSFWVSKKTVLVAHNKTFYITYFGGWNHIFVWLIRCPPQSICSDPPISTWIVSKNEETWGYMGTPCMTQPNR